MKASALLLPLAFGLASPAFAAGAKPCVKRLEEGFREPATLEKLLECQARSLERLEARRRVEGEGPLGLRELEEIGARNRAEIRDYLARHPERAFLEGEDLREAESEAGEGSERAAASDPIDALFRKAMKIAAQKEGDPAFERAMEAAAKRKKDYEENVPDEVKELLKPAGE